MSSRISLNHSSVTPLRDRSTSKTFISSDVFYGDTLQSANDRFTTSTSLMQRQNANSYQQVDG